jgi:tetratricopeptide (TPR) repeat protein
VPTSSEEAKSLFQEAGNAVWLEHKPRKAVELLKKVAQLDPGFVDPQLELARIIYHHFPDRLETALKAVLMYLSSRPEDWYGCYWLGHIHQSLGKVQDAEEAYRRAIALDPFERVPLIALGLLLLKQNRFSEAIPPLQQAIEWFSVRRGYAEAATRLSLADAYEKSGNVVAAIEQWKIVAGMEELWEEDEGTRARAECRLKEYEK